MTNTPLEAGETVETDGFRVFRNPKSVVVVGASADPSKWGNWLATGALRTRHRRQVYLVNSRGTEIDGVQSYRALSELPEAPELVVISVHGAQVLAAVREALAMGSRAFVVISARVEGEDELAAEISEAGAQLIGPNSLGIYSAEGDLSLMWGRMDPGTLAVVSQSGQLGSEIAALGKRAGIGVSTFVSLGNQIDIDAADVLRSLIYDQYTRTVALYIEDFSYADRVFQAVRELRTHGIAVIFLTTGMSDASRMLAQSHTGAMTSSSELVDAACRASGALRVNTPAELVQIAAILDKGISPAGRRIGVISDSGGQGGIAADVASDIGLELPALSSGLVGQLEAALPAGASVRNPIDLAGAGEGNLDVYAELTRLLALSGEIDVVLLTGYFGSYGLDEPGLAKAEQRVARAIGTIEEVPVVVHAMAARSETSEVLHESGAAVFGRVEDALRAIQGSLAVTSHIPREIPVSETDEVLAADNVEVRQALALAGIPFPELRIVRSQEEARLAAASLPGLLVLKAAWLAHKTEVGGVRLGIDGPEEAAEAFAVMHATIGDGPYTLEVQDEREGVAEYIVAARRDPAFGPVVTVGYGGTETEIWRDVVTETVPIATEGVLAAVSRLRSSALLGPWRGRAALDVRGLAEIASLLGHILLRSPELGEVELNPVRVGSDGALAVDCMAVANQNIVAGYYTL